MTCTEWATCRSRCHRPTTLQWRKGVIAQTPARYVLGPEPPLNGKPCSLRLWCHVRSDSGRTRRHFTSDLSKDRVVVKIDPLGVEMPGSLVEQEEGPSAERHAAAGGGYSTVLA